MCFIEGKSFAKINLSLNVTGKLKLLYKIEIIVSFISLCDFIFIKKIKRPDHQISFYGNFAKNIDNNKTVTKLFKILDEKKLLKDRKFQIRIKKNIPQEAGLGGGSMNASSVLNFLLKKTILKISQTQLQNISILIVSDVIL